MTALLLALLLAPAAGATDSVRTLSGADVRESGPARVSPLVDSLLDGAALDSGTVRSALEKGLDRAESEGFLAAAISADRASWTDSGLKLQVRAQTGQRFRWGGARDRGTTRLTPEALSRLSGIPAGEVAAPSDMEAARRRLVSTGYVKEVDPPGILRRPRTVLVDMATRLEDLPASSAEAAGTWTRGGSASGFVEISLRDMLGTARDLDFGLSSGESGTNAHVRWKEPWIGSLDLELRVSGELSQDTLARSAQASLEGGWTSRDGSWTFTAGLLAARRAERATGDSTFGPDLDEWGTCAGAAWSSAPASPWPSRRLAAGLRLEAVDARSDTGGLRRLRARAKSDIFRPMGPFVLHLGGDARCVWPLDASAGLSEALTPGGISGWRGWPEGSPRTPAWAWSTLELRLGSSTSGGVLAFAEPGVRALRRQDLSWSPRGSASWGGGAVLILPGWLVELAVAARDDTRDWTESLLQVRAVNRF